jgi:hypothetical protein
MNPIKSSFSNVAQTDVRKWDLDTTYYEMIETEKYLKDNLTGHSHRRA